jgi:3-isopropylmalate/(R)-2-methylmalate dehydratase small subunit
LKNGVLPIELDVQKHQGVMQAVIQADGHTPIHVDLRRSQITVPGLGVVAFSIDPQHQRLLLEGLDEISMTLKHLDAIERWELSKQRVT